MYTTNQTHPFNWDYKKVNESNRDTGVAYLIPDNSIHVITNLGKPITRSLVGSVRPSIIPKNSTFILGCQSRASILESEELNFLDLKIPAIFSQLLFDSNQPFIRNLTESIIDLGLKNECELSAYLARAYDWEAYDPDLLLEDVIDLIKKYKGEIKIKDVFETLGVSKSLLEQRFSLAIGLTAKEFAKIEKLNHFISNYYKYKDSLNLTQLTFKSGYYDQSHLIKDFRYYTDQSPGEFLRSYTQ